jgi:hypothetical protein
MVGLVNQARGRVQLYVAEIVNGKTSLSPYSVPVSGTLYIDGAFRLQQPESL